MRRRSSLTWRSFTLNMETSRATLVIQGPPVADLLFAKASKTRVGDGRGDRADRKAQRNLAASIIPYFYVTAVSETPMGAHPTACYPFYAYDRPHTALYYEAARKGADAFCGRNISTSSSMARPDHDDYLARIGGEATRARLATWRDGDDAWKRLYVDEGAS